MSPAEAEENDDASQEELRIAALAHTNQSPEKSERFKSWKGYLLRCRW